MTEDRTAVLAKLVAPHSLSQFLSDHWPERTFAAHGDPSRLPAFLLAPEFAGIDALARRYHGTLRFTQGRNYQKMVSIDQVDAMALYRMGLTLQFEDIEPVVAETGAALRRLEAELGIKPGSARISAFASPAEDGLSLHFDAQDIFSIQLKGSKRFRVAPVDDLRYPSGTQFVPGSEPFDDLYPQASHGFPVADHASLTTVEMQPGSVLYMPRGTWHCTESCGDSLSVSIGLYVPSALDCLMSQLRPLLLQDPGWRRPLYGAWGDAAQRSAATTQAAALLTQLPAQLDPLNAADFITQLLPAEQRLGDLRPGDRFQKTPHSTLEMDTQNGSDNGVKTLVVKTWEPNYGTRATLRMKVHPEALKVFRWFTDQDRPFTAAEVAARFPRFADAEQRHMLRLAVEGGLLRLLWYPALADITTTAAGGRAANSC